MRQLEKLLDVFAQECSKGNEYDNRERIAEARAAVIAEVKRLCQPRSNINKDEDECICINGVDYSYNMPRLCEACDGSGFRSKVKSKGCDCDAPDSYYGPHRDWCNVDGNGYDPTKL